jgi:hypothetical protein
MDTQNRQDFVARLYGFICPIILFILSIDVTKRFANSTPSHA